MKTILAAVTFGAILAGCSAGGDPKPKTPGTAEAADLIVTVDKNAIADTGAETATVTVTAVDSSRNIVGGAPVTIVPDRNGLITSSSATTASGTGQVTGVLAIGADKSNRTIDVVVTSGSITKTVKVDVTGAQLQATPSSAAPATTATVQFVLADKAGTPIAGEPIAVTLNGGAATTASTDVHGAYTYSYTAPSSPTASISATAAGVTTATTVTISTINTSPASGTVSSASLAANPATINVNTAGSTTNQVAVRGLFLGAGNAPISNVRVRFDLNGDPNLIGGTLTSGTNYVYTDANGVAVTSYIPGTRGSGNQQLIIRACWSETDFTAPACPNSAAANITVAQSGVSISIFHSNAVVADAAKLTYTQPFTVQVVDSVGQPIRGVLVTGSVDLPRFYRGYWSGPAPWVQVVLNVCDNEDINRNSVLETYTGGVKEDQNSSGKLEPYAADVAITAQAAGSDTTDAFGLAYFNMQYGQNIAGWDDYTLSFSALVAGTEGKAATSGTLGVLASAVTAAVAPPFELSPYSLNPASSLPAAVTTATITDPSTGRSGLLCHAQP
ncbi:MAG: hypothetical protein ABIR54_13120 [Burkholderiaceae bacterium]